MILTSETQNFIRLHADDDVRELALKSDNSRSNEANIDLPFALDQIRGRQIARHKLPSWAAVDGIIYPPHISMEQCSSEVTARYKARVAERFVQKERSCLVDITGGFGVDFSYLAQGFGRCVYVERQEHLCEIARHNMPLLGLSHAEVVCGDGVEWMKGQSEGAEAQSEVRNTSPTTHTPFIFLDPARRDSHGNRTYAIGDCTPDVLSFIDELAEKSEAVMIKLSPMLDWHATVEDINRAVSGHDAVREVHIISTANECKELLIIVSKKCNSPISIHCVNDEQIFTYVESEPYSRLPHASPSAGNWLFVPNSSIMKAGCFIQLGQEFNLSQLSSNSHLFVSEHEVDGFPGKCYEIIAVSSMNKKELRTALQGIEQANIATRNFPLSPDQLRKRLKLRDGGDVYIFATTTEDKQHMLYFTKKK